MAFSWADYLGLAKRLAAEDGEAEQRTAISRAYYSAFNQAHAWLQLNTRLTLAPGRMHEQVWEAFRGGSPSAVEIYKDGDRLKKKRHVADYKVPFEGALVFDKGHAIQLATKLTHALTALRKADVPG